MDCIIIFLLTCFFENIAGRGPPTLLPNSPNFVTLDVYENNPVELQCPVSNTPDLSFQWSKNNEDLDPIWPSLNMDIKRSILKIRQVQLSDTGLYKCNVVNGFGSTQAQFQINVRSNGSVPNNIYDNEQRNEMTEDLNFFNGVAPEFISRSDNGQIGLTKLIQPEGTTAQLTCSASGKPPPEVRWKKNGKILSADEYGITQAPILLVKDLRQSDSGNYTCEIFNSFGYKNATYMLIVTEKLQFFGNNPQNISVERGEEAVLNCSVQTNDLTTKIRWLKKINARHSFRPDAIVIGSEQYEIIEQLQELQYHSNKILSRPLIFSSITSKEVGQYICLIQNGKATNYKKAFLNIINNSDSENIIASTYMNKHLFVIVIPLCILGVILFFIFCLRHRRQKANHRHSLHSRSGDSVKSSSIKQRQPLIHHNGVIVPSITTRTSNDYIANSIDSIPITRQYQQHQRYGVPVSSDLASLTSSNLYYARVQAL